MGGTGGFVGGPRDCRGPGIASVGEPLAWLDDKAMFERLGGVICGKEAFYADGDVPTVRQLVERILIGR